MRPVIFVPSFVLSFALIAVALRSVAAADPAPAQHARKAPVIAEQAGDARGAGDDIGARSDDGGTRGTDDDREARDDGGARDAGDGGRTRVGRRRSAGPPISAVLSAAYAAGSLDRDPGRGWVQRTRLAGLIPWLTVRTARDTSWQDAHAEVGHGTSLEFRATWRLDRLLFDGRELQVATIEAARRRERTRLASHVIRAYYAWRRAAGGTTRTGDDRATARIDDAGRVYDDRATTRLDEAVAELDALTDSWFSEQLARLDH